MFISNIMLSDILDRLDKLERANIQKEIDENFNKLKDETLSNNLRVYAMRKVSELSDLFHIREEINENSVVFRLMDRRFNLIDEILIPTGKKK